jgi:hypothetical protein
LPAPGRRFFHRARGFGNGELSLILALGLKISNIVIGREHCGYGTGAIGPMGLKEECLAVAHFHEMDKYTDRLGGLKSPHEAMSQELRTRRLGGVSAGFYLFNRLLSVQ